MLSYFRTGKNMLIVMLCYHDSREVVLHLQHFHPEIALLMHFLTKLLLNWTAQFIGKLLQNGFTFLTAVWLLEFNDAYVIAVGVKEAGCIHNCECIDIVNAQFFEAFSFFWLFDIDCCKHEVVLLDSFHDIIKYIRLLVNLPIHTWSTCQISHGMVKKMNS